MGILPVQFQTLDPANTAFMYLYQSGHVNDTGTRFFLRGLVQRKGMYSPLCFRVLSL